MRVAAWRRCRGSRAVNSILLPHSFLPCLGSRIHMGSAPTSLPGPHNLVRNSVTLCLSLWSPSPRRTPPHQGRGRSLGSLFHLIVFVFTPRAARGSGVAAGIQRDKGDDISQNPRNSRGTWQPASKADTPLFRGGIECVPVEPPWSSRAASTAGTAPQISSQSANTVSCMGTITVPHADCPTLSVTGPSVGMGDCGD